MAWKCELCRDGTDRTALPCSQCGTPWSESQSNRRIDEDGYIPANTKCFWSDICEIANGGGCSRELNIDRKFSCAAARGFEFVATDKKPK